MAGIKSYDDEMFIDAVKKFGPDTAYGFAKGLKLHQSLLRRRLDELASKGSIVRVSSFPVTYGPKPNEKLQPPDPGPVEKAKFFSELMDPKSELATIEAEILNFIERKKERVSVGKLSKLLGYHRNTVGMAVRHLETKGYLASKKEGRHIFYSRTGIEPEEHITPLQEMRAMLSVESLLSIIQNAFRDLESQVKILTAQNEAFRNVSENTHFKNRTLVDEETIREDERKIVFKALSKIIRLSPEIIADWYKAGK